MHPIAYFLTFSTYGTRLHGDKRGSVHHQKNQFATPHFNYNSGINEACYERLNQPVFYLNTAQRAVSLEIIKTQCIFRKWALLAAHVRTNHIHIVLQANETPEKILTIFKSYISRALNDLQKVKIKRWTRHGSTLYLWKTENLEAVIKYVIYEQGELMEYYKNEKYLDY